MTHPRLIALCLGFIATAASAQAADYRVLDRIAGPDGGWDYARVDAANHRVLVTRGTSVMVVDPVARTAAAGFAPGQRLHDALPVNGGAEVLVTNGGSDTVVFADARSGAALATVHTGEGPDAAAFDPRSGLVLVMDHAGGDITLVDPKTHAVAGTIVVGGDLEAAAVDGAGKAYVNVEDRNEIVAIDIAGRKVLNRYKLAGCDGPTGLAYDAADRELIAACDGTTVVVAAATGEVLQSLPTGKGADGVAFDAARKRAFVPAGRAGTLAILAFRKGKAAIVQTLPTAVSARTIALDEATGRVYLPSARFGPPPAGGGRPPMIPGSFELIVVGL